MNNVRAGVNGGGAQYSQHFFGCLADATESEELGLDLRCILTMYVRNDSKYPRAQNI